MKKGEETAVFLSSQLEELTKLVSPSERPLSYLEIARIDIGENLDTVLISFMIELDGYLRTADAELQLKQTTGMIRLVRIRNVKYSLPMDRHEEFAMPTPLIIATGTDALCKEMVSKLNARSGELVEILTEGEVKLSSIEVAKVEKKESGYIIVVFFYPAVRWDRFTDRNQPVEAELVLETDGSLQMQ
jgi:hypothetical protein